MTEYNTVFKKNGVIVKESKFLTGSVKVFVDGELKRQKSKEVTNPTPKLIQYAKGYADCRENEL